MGYKKDLLLVLPGEDESALEEYAPNEDIMMEDMVEVAAPKAFTQHSCPLQILYVLESAYFKLFLQKNFINLISLSVCINIFSFFFQ